MKSIQILAIAMIFVTTMPIGVLLCNNSNIANDVSNLAKDAEIVVSDIGQEASSLTSRIVRLPVDLAAGIISLAGSGIGYILFGGSQVIEQSGVLLTKVGDVGKQIISTSQEHRTITGIVGLTAVGMLLGGTDTGRYLVRRIHRAVQILLGLEEDDLRCPCDDHRKIAMYLNE